MRIHSTDEIGRVVRALRDKLGVTQTELAMTSSTGVRFIVDLEKGKPTCQIGKALRVLATLGATIHVEGPPGVSMDLTARSPERGS